MNELRRKVSELPIAIKKSDLSPEECDVLFSEQFYSSLSKRNQQSLTEYICGRDPDFDREFMEQLYKNTRVNGALDIRNILRKAHHSSFLDNTIRLSRTGTYTRGYSYLVSRDTGLTAAEKLSIYKADLFDALACMINCASRIESFILSDYIKNAIITMLNALVSQEKIGIFSFDNDEYQRVRSDLIGLAAAATRFHYQFFFKDRPFAVPDHYADRAKQAVAYLERKSGKRWSRLHAASLSRPEASHPLVIFSAALKIAVAHQDVETIVGVPSGGTELAFLIGMQYDFLYRVAPQTILLPLSLHSVKDIYGDFRIDESRIGSFVDQYRRDLSGRNVLICDDNSSTGRTLDYTCKAIKPLVGHGKVFCAVAEIDVNRSLIDRANPQRQYVANPVVFEHSISILPVSKKLRPKADIKELMEKQEIVRHHRRCHSDASDEVEAIYREVMVDVNRRDTTELIANTPPDSLINNIQGTALSNFYAIPIVYNGVTYPSVEHAYQHQKFTPEMLASVDDKPLEEIREAMRLRGFGAPIQDLDALFTDGRFNAGNIKIIGDILRKHGFGKQHWAGERVRTMIGLLLTKFSNEEMKSRLLATKGKVIVEGNHWEDTLWGYCNGRGRNLLGRILMNIRERESTKEPDSVIVG